MDNDNNCYNCCQIDVFKTDGFFENDLLININRSSYAIWHLSYPTKSHHPK